MSSEQIEAIILNTVYYNAEFALPLINNIKDKGPYIKYNIKKATRFSNRREEEIKIMIQEGV